MRQLIKYLIVYPLVTLIDLIDSVIGFVYLDSYSNRKLKHLPAPETIHSVQVDVASNHISYRSVNGQTLFKIDEDDLNVYEAVARSSRTYADVKMLGYREIVSLDEDKQANGKVLKKVRMKNEFTWITYKEMVRRVDDLANGLLNIGIKSNDNIVIFAETRPEWLMSAVACFKIKVPIVTLYATLGLEALAYGINQTNATYIIASGESVQKLQKVIDKCEKLKNIIVITDKFTEKHLNPLKEKSLNVFSLKEVEDIGRTKPRIDSYERPKKNDLAIIMYTSGSTGTPKGAMMSHGNLLTSLISLIPRFGERNSHDELYISYLPSAHVLELCSQIGWLIKGIGIGYSSPFTLTDNSTAIKEGDLGDITVLKPTFMIAVPIVLERIKKAVEEKMAKQSELLKTLFEFASAKRLIKAKQGKSSFLIDRLLFKKIKAALGGNLETLLVGGSALNRDVHEFGQACFCRVIQAYGLTETCAAATTQYPNETVSDQVGSVVECGELRLVDWPEGGYRITDKPNPRGEIWIGGDQICLGYYNMPDKTQEDFRIVDGIRFFATGDIGEMSPEGNLSIIDRKKDLVKLQGGEYIALNKIENVVKLMPLVDNCCIIAHPSKSYCMCIITPNLKKAQELLDSNKSNGNTNHSNENQSQDTIGDFINLMESNSKLGKSFDKELVDFCLSHGLERFEIPTKSKFVKEVWLPDSGLVTDSLKLKRREIEKFYENEIKTTYV